MPSPSTSLSASHLAVASMRHYWRVSLSLACGVAIATAVIVGALLVGDSMRGSLRALTMERLGKIDSIIFPGGFFEVDGIIDDDSEVHAVMLFPTGVAETVPPSGVASTAGSQKREIRRAGAVQILGVDESFWNLESTGNVPSTFPDDDSVILNRSAADELGVQVGDIITIRLPVESAVPADSPLGRRDAETEGLPRMRIVDIIDDDGLGRFSLAPSQIAPQNVYLRRETIASVLDRSGQANGLISSGPLSVDQLNLDLDDFGIQTQRVTSPAFSDGPDEPPVFDYYSVSSERLLLDDTVVETLRAGLPPDSVTPVMTYLANALETLDENGAVIKTVPYSIITAMDSTDDLPLDFSLDPSVPKPDQAVPLVINDWTAKQLDVSEGDALRLAYFEPEVERGQEVEHFFDAVVASIVPITEPSRRYLGSRPARFQKRPTVYNDPDLTPTVPGVTDQDSIDDWDTPFPRTRETNRSDDDYWNNYRLTPKAFMPLKEGQRLFSSRFGDTTSLKIDASVAEDLDELETILASLLLPKREDLGWTSIPIREQQLAASSGTTPFDALFLSLSFFVIVAAMALIAMLFRLGVQARIRELGTLLAVGWTVPKVSQLLLREGVALSALGVLLGVAGGFGYAWLVLAGLRSYWVGAVTVPFLEFHWRPLSLAIGGSAGFLVALATLWFSLRSIMKSSVIDLLRGTVDSDNLTFLSDNRVGKLRWRRRIFYACVLLAVALGIGGASASGTAAAGAFVGGGMLLLIAGVLWIHDRLSTPSQTDAARTAISDAEPSTGTTVGSPAARMSIHSLALLNARRNPLRSTLTIALMSVAAFLILAMAAFQLSPDESGTGGFELIGGTAQPVYRDLANPDVRRNWLGTQDASLENIQVVAMRQRRGQDASCNNLYQATQPTILGVDPDSMVAPSDTDASSNGARFAWVSYEATDSSDSPWQSLAKQATGTESDPIPVVIDQNTAMWSLQLRAGHGEVCQFEYDDRTLYFQVAGLLANTVLQGQLLISEDNFRLAFPNISGYSKFLIDVPENVDTDTAASIMESRFGDVGMDLSDTRSVLAGLMSVQNTYLRTFQSLGTLGLLLGTIGLAITQLRTVLERRRELAVMQAIGIRRIRLANMVMTETFLLLLAGLGLGGCCALAAVLPYGWTSGLHPPLGQSLLTVVGILAFGSIAGLLAVSRVMRMPLLGSLRGN